MGLFDKFRDSRVKMTYDYHGNLYWGTVKNRVSEQYEIIIQNEEIFCDDDPEIVQLEMVILVHALDLMAIAKVYSPDEYSKMLRGMTKAVPENLGIINIESYMELVKLYIREMNKASDKNVNPIMHCVSILRQRCNFYGADYIETNILARSLFLCCTKWDSVKKDMKFISESDAANRRKNDIKHVYGNFNNPLKTREGIIYNLFENKITAQQARLIINEFDNWNDAGQNRDVFFQTIFKITSNKLNETDIDFIIKLLIMERHMGFDQLMATFGAGNVGTNTDEIPGSYGGFGVDLTNPIPTQGLSGSEEYLGMLRTKDGHQISWNRIGSTTINNIPNPIDIFAIYDRQNGNKLTTLYFSPYNKRNSSKVPEGFVFAN